MLCYGCYVYLCYDIIVYLCYVYLCYDIIVYLCYDENTMFHEMQSGENDGLLVQDIEWGSQGIDYMTYLRNQIANQLLSNESN